ncbi:MAG: ISNCY family transposase [Ignavibacteriales bacterium]|nr:ISNCY family transposase [Ignavibacteriales bacterium]
MIKTITLSSYEMERLKVILRIGHHQLTVAEAAESLDMSERQLYRILQRYRAEGEAGLCHRLRGRRSNKALAEELRIRALRLYREQYFDYGPTLFAEKLSVYHDVSVSRQTATRWLSLAALWSGNRKKRPHRKKRERRETIGSLIQFDGSPHDWFEGRAAECCLLVAIDDASNRQMFRFVPVEETYHVLAFWRDYVERYGIPAEIYTDWGSVYINPDNPERLTPFGRALKTLGIRHIKAGSPQAKGRVERSNRTHQDRLIKALREHNISTMEEANGFLEAQYMNAHNHRFAHTNGLTDIHRSGAGIDLANIFCLEEIRHVYNDWTITLNAQFIQLLKSDAPLPPPRSKVIVRQWLDGSLHIFWKEHQLAFKPLKHKPKSLPRPPRPPAPDHPWRSKFVGGLSALRKKHKTLAQREPRRDLGA